MIKNSLRERLAICGLVASLAIINFQSVSAADSKWTTTAHPVPGGLALSIADFNNDGLHELLGSRTSKGDFRLDAMGLENIVKNGRVSRDVRFADFDNDGFLDAIANVYSVNPESNIQLYWGCGVGKFCFDRDFDLLGYRGYGETILVADFNNDSRLDVFIPQYHIGNSTRTHNRNLLLVNEGSRSFIEMAIPAGIYKSRTPYPEGAQAVDINNDGWIDIYVGASLFINGGRDTLEFSDESVKWGLPLLRDEGAKFLDYDNDLDLDLALISVTEKGFEPVIFENTGDFFRKDTGAFPGYKPHKDMVYGLFAGDFDSDLDVDILLAGGANFGGEYQRPELLKNINGKFRSVAFPFPAPNEKSDLVGMGDLNGDGVADLYMRYAQTLYLMDSVKSVPNIKILITDGETNRNQSGRMISFETHRKKIVKVIDGGSGYMSNSPYEVTVPNRGLNKVKVAFKCGTHEFQLEAVRGVRHISCLKEGGFLLKDNYLSLFP